MSGTYNTRYSTCPALKGVRARAKAPTPQICNVRHISTNTEANHKGAHGSRGGEEGEGWDGMGWAGECGRGKAVRRKKKNEGIESASCVRKRASSPEITPPPPTTVGVVSRRGTLVDSGGSAARARGLMKSLVLAVERASPRSALGTKGARRVPPTCGRLQRRLREAFAVCRVPQALLDGSPTFYFFVLFSRDSLLGAETE